FLFEERFLELVMGDQPLPEEDLTQLVGGSCRGSRTQLVENEQHNIWVDGGKSTPEGWCKSLHYPRKQDVGAERFDQFRSNAGHAVESRKPAEQTVLLAPGDDPVRERRTDPREQQSRTAVVHGAPRVAHHPAIRRIRIPRAGPENCVVSGAWLTP